MKNVSSVFVLLLVASLWGLVEVLPLSTFLYCAAGVLFLTLGRRLVPLAGSALLIGLVVCAFKTLNSSFMVCQWTGVMSIAVGFEAATLLFRNTLRDSVYRDMIVGAATCLIALPVFIGWIVGIAEHPYWIEGGWERIGAYALQTSAVAAALSLITAPAGRFLAEALQTRTAPVHRPAFALGSVIIIVCWIIAVYPKLS